MNATPPSTLPASEPSGPAADHTRAPLPQRPLTARRTFVVLLVALAFGCALLFVYTIRQVIAWLLVATLLAVALEPAVAWLTRHRWRRTVASVVVSLLFFLIIVGILAGLTAPFITQAKDLVTNLPHYIQDLFRSGPLKFLETRFHIIEHLKSVSFESVVKVISGGSGSVISALSKGASLVFASVTVLTLMVMLLIEGPRTWGGFVALFGSERREWVDRLGERVGNAVGGYVRGNLFISVIAATGAYIVLLVLGVPYPLPLALLVGVLDIIPLVGATIAAVVCIIVGFTQGWVPGVILIGYFVAYQQIENNFIQPVVYSRTVSLSPLVVLVASLVGAIIAGILGVLVAIPLASALFILVDEYRARRGAATGWEILQPLERVEATAPDVGEVLQTEEATRVDEQAEAQAPDLGDAQERRIAEGGGEPAASEGPPTTMTDEPRDAQARGDSDGKGANHGADRGDRNA